MVEFKKNTILMLVNIGFRYLSKICILENKVEVEFKVPKSDKNSQGRCT